MRGLGKINLMSHVRCFQRVELSIKYHPDGIKLSGGYCDGLSFVQLIWRYTKLFGSYLVVDVICLNKAGY